MEFNKNQTPLLLAVPHCWVLKLIARIVLLALAIISFPWIMSFFDVSQHPLRSHTHGGSVISPLLFQDLSNEGLFKLGGNALFLNCEHHNADVHASRQILVDNDIVMVDESDEERLSSIPDSTFDFVISSGFTTSEFIDRSLKNGGIVVVRLSNDASKVFKIPSNYKIVYLRRFDTTVIAMKKIAQQPEEFSNLSLSGTGRRLLGFESEARRAVLEGLEDVVLEPPRGSSTVFKKFSRKTKYLPDITGDSLDGYPRRVFIDVALPEKANGGSIEWFKKNYPTRNRLFDIYSIEMVAEESASAIPHIGEIGGMSDWLRKNVKEEEYVVMKAEAGVVEEMISTKAISLVDEMFLDCQHQWQRGRKNKSRRAYWECLAIYGRLRDEGIAVHQWWE